MALRLISSRLPEPSRSPAFDDAALGAVAPNDPTDLDGFLPPRLAPSDAERRLMADVLLLAVMESRDQRRGFEARRRSAREWLRDEPGFTAKECCEALGLDYGTILKRLEEEWQRSGE